MSVTWLVDVDTNDNLTYSTAIAAVRVRGIRIERGMADAYDRVAKEGRLRLWLDNASGDYTAEPSSDLEIGWWLRVRATVGVTTYPVFAGQIEDSEPDRFGWSVTVYGRIRYLDERKPLSLYVGSDAGTILSEVVGASGLRRNFKTSAGVWYARVGTGVRSQVGSVKVGPSSPPLLTIGTGRSEFAYYGDSYERSPSIASVVRDVTLADFGWFYEGKDGALIFRNRSYELVNDDLMHTFNEEEVPEAGRLYKFGTGLVNKAMVRVQPRFEQSGVTLWSVARDLKIPDGTSEWLVLPRNTDGRAMGVLRVDGYAFEWENDEGADVGFVTGPVLRIQFEADGDKVLLAGSNVSGVALVQEDPQEFVLSKVGSHNDRGVRWREFDFLPLVETDRAMNYARYLLGHFSQPRGVVEHVILERDFAVQLSLEILDRVRCKFDDIGHDDYYRVVGLSHDASGGKLKTFFRLVPDGSEGYALVGSGERSQVGRVKVGY